MTGKITVPKRHLISSNPVQILQTRQTDRQTDEQTDPRTRSPTLQTITKIPNAHPYQDFSTDRPSFLFGEDSSGQTRQTDRQTDLQTSCATLHITTKIPNSYPD
jgi:hypothetical protein